jgi:hypothetical protein
MGCYVLSMNANSSSSVVECVSYTADMRNMLVRSHTFSFSGSEGEALDQDQLHHIEMLCHANYANTEAGRREPHEEIRLRSHQPTKDTKPPS